MAASEIKAIIQHPAINVSADNKTIFTYLSSGYGYMDVSDSTFFAGIKQLRAGHYIKVGLKNNYFKQIKSWDMEEPGNRYSKNEHEVSERFYELFEDYIRLRLRSDVPIGISLSGGLLRVSPPYLPHCVLAKLQW